MLPYWLLFGFASLPAFETMRSGSRARAGILALSLALVIIALIGFRFEIGADWFAYVRIYRQIAILDLGDALTVTDPAYGLLNYLGARSGLGFVFVNLACAVIFTIGLFRFCFTLPNPWLALATSIPYLVVVVAMGYARQGVALGCMMLGLAALSRQSFLSCIGWILAAAMFHKTAILIIPFVGIAYSRHRALTTTAAAILLPVVFYALVAGQFGTLMSTYVEYAYGSQGAVIRVLIAALPGAIFIFYRKRFDISDSERVYYLSMSAVAIALVPVVFLTTSTTLIDRFALYLLPLQLVVASWLPKIIARRGQRNPSVVLALLSYAAAIQFIWLNYATHAQSWVPYRSYSIFGGVPDS